VTDEIKKKTLRLKTDKKFRGRVIMGIRELIFTLPEIKFPSLPILVRQKRQDKLEKN
jgi:hypothetical protein